MKDIELLEKITLTSSEYGILIASERNDNDIKSISASIFEHAKRVFKDDLDKIFKAETLKDAINNTNYCCSPGAGLSYERNVHGETIYRELIPFVSLGIYSLYRWAKSMPRRAQRQEITDENFIQVLLDILNDYGNDDKKSYKWDVLRQHAKAFALEHNDKYYQSCSKDGLANCSYQDYGKHLVLNEIANHSIYFTDADVEKFVSDIKEHLSILIGLKQESQASLTN